jgi:uncharacterized protein (DUF3084 family)
MTRQPSFAIRLVALAAGVLLSMSAQAALFEDSDARRAILDLRQRLERQGEEIQNVQRTLLQQQNQFEALRTEAARLRGEKEELSQELSKELRRAKEHSQGMEERLKKFEPVAVKVSGETYNHPSG